MNVSERNVFIIRTVHHQIMLQMDAGNKGVGNGNSDVRCWNPMMFVYSAPQKNAQNFKLEHVVASWLMRGTW